MRSQNRVHDRDSFFKYVSAATALLILQRCTLRWSSPILFNDPFDVPRELSFGISSADIVRACSRRMASLIEEPPEDTSDLEPKVRLIVETVKRGITSELRAQLLAGLEDLSETHRPPGESMEEFRKMWRELLPNFRILCLTESPAHAAMWYHYADRYTGVVIELRCDDDLDSAWLAARPVSYAIGKPAVYTADGWAKYLTTDKMLALERMLHDATFTKSPDWSYEREWRITSFKGPRDTGPFTDYRLNPSEVAAVYLGPTTAPADKVALIAIAALYPGVRLFDVSIGMNREFAFIQVGG